MSHLQYFDYEGFGRKYRKVIHYAQAVRVGDTIETSGQGKQNHASTCAIPQNHKPRHLKRHEYFSNIINLTHVNNCRRMGPADGGDLVGSGRAGGPGV